ncbi:hypothetical protein F5J12DRAFT_782312 [Pisolithus orientalis]|uniref:uncharacterized protein n=1 Tax=Pisolithus orientalis TaxID=936130 RepID=UPI002224AFFC|nr:uncharacterized protein F5J12DRAFT_782312 [Pisolithus orientalis]KAI6008904.1 hypothetical protein F5J12DRAFT_782312 [Pisolithus orientalis]
MQGEGNGVWILGPEAHRDGEICLLAITDLTVAIIRTPILNLQGLFFCTTMGCNQGVLISDTWYRRYYMKIIVINAVFNLQHESKSQLNHEALLLLDVVHAQCEAFCAEQALAACITHEYESMAKLYKYKVGSSEAQLLSMLVVEYLPFV